MAINQAGEQCFAIGMQHRCPLGHRDMIAPTNLLDALALNDNSGVAYRIMAGAINECGTKNRYGLGGGVWRRHEVFPSVFLRDRAAAPSRSVFCGLGHSLRLRPSP